MSSTSIKTFIFMDLESTGLPSNSRRKVKITEICLIAVNRSHLSNCRSRLPRILNKLVLAINPNSPIDDEVFGITGMNNEMLEEVSQFNQNTSDAIRSFISLCPEPCCIISHNGFRFDFRLLREELKLYPQTIPNGILCADSLEGFKFLYETDGAANSIELSPYLTKTDLDLLEFTDHVQTRIQYTLTQMPDLQAINETTPPAQIIRTSPVTPLNATLSQDQLDRVRRKLFEPPLKRRRARLSLKLGDVYSSLFNTNIPDAHNAESDSVALLECCARVGEPILKYFDSNSKFFGDIPSLYNKYYTTRPYWHI